MAPSATPDRLLADLGTTFRPQRQWVEGRGIWLIVGGFSLNRLFTPAEKVQPPSRNPDGVQLTCVSA